MPRQAYYAARAIEERRLSQSAGDARSAAAHAELSARYDALASDPSLNLPGMWVTDDVDRHRLS